MFVILNEKSGGGRAIKKWQKVSEALQLNNNSTEVVYVGSNEVEEKLQNAFNKGKTDFAIAGGDGTINYFLNQLINITDPEILSRVKIGAIGIGSSNDFHKPFQSENTVNNIPFKLNFDNTIYRDVGCLQFEKDGKLHKKYFFINASIGVTAEGNNFFNNPDSILRFLKKSNTQSAIAYAAIKNILTYKNFLVTIESDKEFFTADISNMGIIKCPFFSGKLRYQSIPLINNGLFDIHLYQSLNKLNLLYLFYCLSNGISDNSFNKKLWKTDIVKITSKDEFAVEFDGEVISTKSVEFSVKPGLIKVCTN